MIDERYRKEFVFLEKLRRSGATNMFGAVPFLEKEFGISRGQAAEILAQWMKMYEAKDYADFKA